MTTVDNPGGWYVGDRVEVDDPGLAQLRDIFARATGSPAPPNHRGYVDEIRGDTLIIIFDDGGAAPYSHNACTRIE